MLPGKATQPQSLILASILKALLPPLPSSYLPIRPAIVTLHPIHSLGLGYLGQSTLHHNGMCCFFVWSLDTRAAPQPWDMPSSMPQKPKGTDPQLIEAQ